MPTYSTSSAFAGPPCAGRENAAVHEGAVGDVEAVKLPNLSFGVVADPSRTPPRANPDADAVDVQASDAPGGGRLDSQFPGGARRRGA